MAKFKKGVKKTDEERELISNAMRNLSMSRNILATLRTETYTNTTILHDLPQVLQEELNEGKTDNVIKFLNLIKENETQTINMTGEVQKVFVTRKRKKEVDKHISEILNNDGTST